MMTDALMSMRGMTVSMDPTATGPASPAQAGWGVSLTDLSTFNQSMQQAVTRVEATVAAQPSAAAQAVMQPLEHLDQEANRLAVDASAASRSGNALSPAEVVHLTYRCHEFLFHTQLTSNAANRTSDGLQQLFKQQ